MSIHYYIHKTVGNDDIMGEIIRKLPRRYTFGEISTRKHIAILKEKSGIDFDQCFENHAYGKGITQIKVAYVKH